MPSKSQSSESESSPEKISTKEIQSRRSIRQKFIKSNINLREQSRSPLRNQPEELYPNLKQLINDSVSDEDDDDEDGEVKQTFQSGIYNASKYKHECNTPASPIIDKSKTPVPPIKPQNEINILYLICGLLFVVLAVICAFKFSSKSPEPRLVTNCSKIMDMKVKYPSQDKRLFKSIKSGVEGMIRNPAEPSVFAFFSTDQKTLNTILKTVVDEVKLCINQTHEPIKLNQDNLSTERLMDDHTKLVVDLKDELLKRSIMIVDNVDLVPTKVVQSLHSFCDTYNPLVARSIIFLTIKVPQKPSGKPIEYITEYLEERWKSLPSNIRGPLITRVLDQTFFLVPEKS